MDKAMHKSVTTWGAAILAIAEIYIQIYQAVTVGGPIDWAPLIAKVIAVIGFFVAVVGGRRALGKLISK